MKLRTTVGVVCALALAIIATPARPEQGAAEGGELGNGYPLRAMFARDGRSEYLDDLGVKGTRAGIWTNHASVNGKVTLPMARFQPYLSGGVGVLNANAGGTRLTVAGRFSAGTDVALTEHVALFLDAAYLLPGGGGVATDLQYFSFGWGGKYLF